MSTSDAYIMRATAAGGCARDCDEAKVPATRRVIAQATTEALHSTRASWARLTSPSARRIVELYDDELSARGKS